MSSLAVPPSPSRAAPHPDAARRALLRIPPALALALSGCVSLKPPPAPQVVAPFSTARELGVVPRGWEDVVMRRDLPRTDYRLAERDGRRVLLASGHGASGLRCRVQADAQATPWLRWSWCTREVPPGMSVDRSDTDDSPARVAVAFHGEERRLSFRDRAFYELVQLITGERLPYATLMYVWDARLPVGRVVNYARTDRIRYLVVESGRERAGRWLRYERNLVQDFRHVFGEEPGAVDSVGVMTDSDDLRVDVETWYGDLRLEAA